MSSLQTPPSRVPTPVESLPDLGADLNQRTYARLPAPMVGEKYLDGYDLEVEDRDENDSIDDGVAVPIEQRPPPLRLRDLEITRTLGKGAQGSVYMARTKRRTHPYDRPGTVYALKALRKKHLRVRESVAGHMYSKDIERSKLAGLRWNPFAAGLVQVFDDIRNVYLLLEFVPCGTLRSIIQKHCTPEKPMSARDAAFYISNVICGLEFMHANDIVHRDIKPDNILVGQDGYLVISDFGLGVNLGDDGAGWTDVGTAYYSAPEVQHYDEDFIRSLNEVIENRFTIDIYSAGAILYEMLTKRVPFIESTKLGTWQKKMEANFIWPAAPKKPFSRNLKNLLVGMLEPFPKSRFKVKDVKESPWLNRIDWNAMISRRYLPPHVPKVSLSDNMWHRQPMPSQKDVPGISIVEPSPLLANDNRFPEPHWT